MSYVAPKVCVVKNCPYKPVALDDKGYTLPQNPGNGFEGDTIGVFEWNDSVPQDSRQIWYCREHAVQYLFPLIDQAKGNTMTGILQDFKDDGMM